MLVTLPNIAKITLSILWLSKVKSHGLPINFRKFQTSSRFYFLIVFTHIWKNVADTIIFDLRKFYCKISKGLWDILGQTWHEMKKLEKWGTFVALISQSWVNFLISQTFWYFEIKFSKIKDNFISNNSSKYKRKPSKNKTVARFENFRKFVARDRNNQFGRTWPLTFESHNEDNVIFSIFGKVISIPEILELFTNVFWR